MKSPTLLLVLSLLTFPLVGQGGDNRDSAVAAILGRIRLPEIPAQQVVVTSYGAAGDFNTDCKPAFDRAMEALREMGGGMLVVPAGTYTLRGPIHLESRVEVHLQPGARIRFEPDPARYLPAVPTSWEGTFLHNYSPMIYARGRHDIAITGEGIIDGEGGTIWADWKDREEASKQLSRDWNHKGVPLEARKLGEGHFLRPQLIQFFDCRNILLSGVRIEDAPFWCTHFLRSSSITIRDISFHAHNKNNDGIDLEYASDVLIEGVDFDNADDNIAIKAGRDHDGRRQSDTPSENIVIRNCRLKGLHALVIGSEMSAGVRNVFVQDCRATGYLKRGIYFKTNSDRGGFIRNIHLSDIELGPTEDCIFVTANYHGEGSGQFASKISGVYISNLRCQSASGTGIVVEGYPTQKVEDMYFDRIEIGRAANGLTLRNTSNVKFNEVVIGEPAGTPSSVK